MSYVIMNDVVNVIKTENGLQQEGVQFLCDVPFKSTTTRHFTIFTDKELELQDNMNVVDLEQGIADAEGYDRDDIIDGQVLVFDVSSRGKKPLLIQYNKLYRKLANMGHRVIVIYAAKEAHITKHNEFLLLYGNYIGLALPDRLLMHLTREEKIMGVGNVMFV